MPTVITSAANPRVKRLIRLRHRRERDRTGTFLIEGYRELRRALQAGVDIVELYFCPELFLVGNEWGVVRAAPHTVQLSEAAFRRVSMRDGPEGLVAVGRRPAARLEGIIVGAAPLVLVAVGIQKPGNLGAMLRTASAVGVDAVIIADPSTDVVGPHVVRASLGALFLLRVAECASADALNWLRARNISVVATSPDPPATPHWEADLTGATAIVVGSEQRGLPPRWLDAAHQRALIEMPGRGADSLNAAAATAVVLYEALRQRRQ